MLVRMMVWDSSRKRRCSSGVRAIVFRRCMSRPLVRPAGGPPRACAARELAEEARVAARQPPHLGTIFTTPGFCDERIHLFLAGALRQAEQRHEADEVIAEIARLPLAEALAMVRRGEIVDGKTIAGLHLAAAALAAA